LSGWRGEDLQCRSNVPAIGPNHPCRCQSPPEARAPIRPSAT
jgi:hypothetical protein